MNGLVAFWSHATAALVFLALLIWRLGITSNRPGGRLLLAGFAMTGCWAWLSAVASGEPIVAFAETARNLVWIVLLHSLSPNSDERQRGVRLVYGAVGAVIGLQLIADILSIVTGSGAIAETAILLRVTTAAGALVLVHNLYGQASPSSRTNIRLAMLALALMWTYDLNLYTILYLDVGSASDLAEGRGAAVALTGPLFALAAKREDGWRVRLSRAATFQSLSLLAICGYFALMAILATALRGTDWDWSRAILIAVLATMTVAAMVLMPSARARSWAKVKISKHLFEHRYDYRTEWLRFTETLGSPGSDSSPLGQRVIKAFADILDSPGGLLLAASADGSVATTANLNWPVAPPPAGDVDRSRDFWKRVETCGRILELDAVRGGWGDPKDLAIAVPDWMLGQECSWVGIPLIHHERMAGLILLAAPEYRRALDWEDFDLLRTAGRQAASSLAEAHGQEALSNAQRFEEFNRRFAFILHDVKNLVSQLSLLTRNAERHADKPEFRSDMIATLRSSVGKMNELLARLSPQAPAGIQRIEPQPLRPLLSSVIAAKRRSHDVRLIGDASLSALVDPVGLEQAIGHLLQNAVEASPPDQPVVVRVSRQGSEVCVTVLDKGCGMDGDFVRNRLFQPFVSTKPGGFGIGSFEARALISAMGGRVVVDSRPGGGSEFSIFLPAADAAEQSKRKRA